jgi:hypothetical protein
MKQLLLLLLIGLISFSSIGAKPSIPPKDSTGKDYCYYFDFPFTSPKSWDSTLFFTKKFLDSFYVKKYEIVAIDSIGKSLKIRITNKLQNHGMLQNTHKPIYSDCLMTFDYIIYYSETGLRCKVKRIIHYYTYNQESSYMGKTNGTTRTMRTESKRVEIPMIQTDLHDYTKKVLSEVNNDITKSIETFKAYKWIYNKPIKKGKKSIEDDDY